VAVRATWAWPNRTAIAPPPSGKLLRRIRELDIPVKTSDRAASEIRAARNERELETFTQLASGRANHKIVDELSLGTNTDANHIASSSPNFTS